MASISCRHVKKVYPGNVTAVPDFNLEIADKEFIVFVGPSGCGKSTTLRMIAGLEEISGTEVPLPKEKTADGKLDAYVGKTLKVGIRPEDIKDDEEFLEKHPNSHLSAEVEVSELMGAEIYLYLTYQGQNLMARVAPTSKSRRGDKITVAMDTHKIHLFDPETEKTLLN